MRTATAADSVTLSSLDDAEESGGRGTVVGSALAVGGLLALIGASIYYQDTIRTFLVYFSTIIEDWGPRGVLAYFVVYTILEVLAVPAIPLTMTAGAIFGILPGSLLTSLAGTLAATISFLIARYVARDRVRSPRRSQGQRHARADLFGLAAAFTFCRIGLRAQATPRAGQRRVSPAALCDAVSGKARGAAVRTAGHPADAPVARHAPL